MITYVFVSYILFDGNEIHVSKIKSFLYFYKSCATKLKMYKVLTLAECSRKCLFTSEPTKIFVGLPPTYIFFVVGGQISGRFGCFGRRGILAAR